MASISQRRSYHLSSPVTGMFGSENSGQIYEGPLHVEGHALIRSRVFEESWSAIVGRRVAGKSTHMGDR
jgi:hypothetical protein